MIEQKTLPCGVRLVTEKIPGSRSASIGIWVGAGAARETAEQNGISHFIEHMCFKGTEKRNFLQLAKEADDIGAALNAFTDKEATCYHIKALTDVFPQAVDLLLDMVCCSKNDASEIRGDEHHAFLIDGERTLCEMETKQEIAWAIKETALREALKRL